MTSPTPADLTLTSRKLSVDRDAVNARWWHGGDPVGTAFFNALSVTFPTARRSSSSPYGAFGIRPILRCKRS